MVRSWGAFGSPGDVLVQQVVIFERELVCNSLPGSEAPEPREARDGFRHVFQISRFLISRTRDYWKSGNKQSGIPKRNRESVVKW